MAPVFLSENEFKKEQGECPWGWVGRVLRIPSGAYSAPRYRHAAGASAAAHRGRPRPLYSSKGFPDLRHFSETLERVETQPGRRF